MTATATKTEFDLTVKDDIEKLNDLQYRRTYTDRNSVEYLCLLESIGEFEKSINVEQRHMRNLQVFNAELYTHGIRRWGFKKSFMVSAEAVHDERKSEHFIYVPMWAVTDYFGMPSGCGNRNQRQIDCNCSLYFGEAHEGKIIDINHANGAFSARAVKDVKDIAPNSEMLYWLNH